VQGTVKEKVKTFIPMEVREGEFARFMNEKTAALISENLLKSGRFRYQVGQKYLLTEFKGVELDIVGSFKSPDPAYNTVILVGLEYLQEVDDARGEASQIYVMVDDVANARDAVKAIDALPLAVSIETREQKAFLATVKRELSDVIAFQRLVMLVAIIVILVGVANTISMATRDRVREIGVLRAVGFERGRIITLVLLEAMLVAFIGGIIGTVGATAYLAISNIEDYYMEMAVTLRVSPMVFAAGALLPLLLGLLGGLPSAYAASRIPIIESVRSVE